MKRKDRGNNVSGRRSKRAGNARTTGKEQFYTPTDIAQKVVSLVLSSCPGAAERPWVEPAGGSGKFLDAFESAGIYDYWSCDIDPKDPRVALGDFLRDPLPAKLHDSAAVVVTNPPFGRNNSLSVPFFNRSAEFASVIAFIIPRSWRKWSVQNRLDLGFHLIADEDIDVDYETADGAKIPGSTGRLLTCVQVWERRSPPRSRVTVEDRGYVRKSTPADADVSLTVFGRGCGLVKTEFERRPNTTQMFLKVASPEVIRALREVDFSLFYRNVAYTEALSISEINHLLNEWFDAASSVEERAGGPLGRAA